MEVPVEVAISTADVVGERFFVLVLRDLSEQLTLQDEAAALTQRLARIERLEALTTLSAGLGREVLAALDVLQAHALRSRAMLEPTSPPWREFEPMLAAIEKARGRVSDVTRFGQVGSPAGPSLVDPTAIVRRAGEVADRGASANVTVTTTIDAPLPKVWVVPHELEQALANLLANGMEAMHARGGRLALVARAVALDAPLTCTTLTLTTGAWLSIAVGDEGEGITDSVLPYVFDPFFSTKPREPRGAGRGLGLAMVYGFARGAGGAIDVETKVGRGSRFSLFLPVASDTASSHPPVASAELGRKVRRVLLVDPDVFVARALKRTLELLGHACHVSTHAADALSLVRLDPGAFDLVVCELNLPSMRGDELAYRLSIIRPGLTVCVMGPADRLPRADGFRVLPKPVTASDIDVVLRSQ